MPRQLYSLLIPLLLAALAPAACQSSPQPADTPREGSAAPLETAAPVAEPPATTEVLPGLEVLLRDSLHLVRSKRVGFVTNQSALTRTGESGIDLLHRAPEVNLVALYGPEHGLRGGVEGGVKIESGRDATTGLPVHSLYGRTQKPTPEMLRGVDVLVFDMQDIGARPYTFVWTMAMAMEAAAAQGIPFVVLDRPNPITGRAEGPLMQMEMRTVGQPITGYYPVPLRHGMTVGEVARYVNQEFGVGARLHVVPAAGWRSEQWFDETALPWVNPSPNIRSLDAALTYSGLVLLEATNLTVGRGTDAPMSYVGAPWLNTASLIARVRQYDLPGVQLDTVRFTPRGPEGAWIPFRGENVRAVRMQITDRDAFQPVFTTLVLMHEIRNLHPQQFKILNQGFTQMMGSRWARQAFDRGEDPREIARRWEQENREWIQVRDRYRLYPAGE
ncbi:MAG: DUF1343 domain-containing protein [Gemmatimonadetes bacterium]|nr:DUF1343 domain-containing protein [Gemmatimonadota bacterium]